MALHRKIDALSNIHPEVNSASARFPTELRRFAPIFLDLLADHSLARHWHQYYAKDIDTYAQACYQAIEKYLDVLPQRGHRFVTYMTDVDLLSDYENWNSIEDGLSSVLRRLSHSLDPAHVYAVCRTQTATADEMLSRLYPDLRKSLAAWDGGAGAGR